MSHIPETNPPIKVGRKRVQKWLARHQLANTPENRKKARKDIRRRKEKRLDPEGKDITFQESAADWQIIYGLQRVGGVYTYAAVADDPSTDQEKNSLLLLVITISCHRMNAVKKVFFDDIQVEFPTDPPNGWSSGAWAPNGDPKVFIQVNLGLGTQTALSQLITDSGGQWTSNHRQAGCGHVYLKLKYNEHLFPNGLPDISFEVEGRVLKSYGGPWTVGYSNNAARCLWDFIDSSVFGPAQNIQFIGVIPSLDSNGGGYEAFEVCDENVPLKNGGTEKRYTCNATFLGTETYASIIEQMLSAFGGSLVDFQSFWYWISIVAPKYRTPTITITEADIIGDVSVSTVESISEYFGALGGTYIDPNKNWEETDFPPYIYKPGSSGNYRDREDISLPCTTSVTMAQRLAKLAALRRKFGLTVRFKARITFFRLSSGDNFMITLDAFGWSSKVFEVQSIGLIMEEDQNGAPYMGVEIFGKENDPAIYDWSIADEVGVTTAPPLRFPTPAVGMNSTPSSLTAQSGNGIAFLQSDGTTVIRVFLSWVAPTDSFVQNGGQIEIQFKRVADSAYISAASVPGNQSNTYVYSLEVGTAYDFRIRSRQSGGSTSNYIYVQHTVQGITSTPPNVSNFVGTVSGAQISLIWDPVYIANLLYYRIKKSVGGQNWSNSTLVGEVIGQPFLTAYTAGDTFKIKAVNTAGVESATETDHVAAATPVTGNPIGILMGITYS